MKKFYLLLIAILTINIANAQWQQTLNYTGSSFAINGNNIFVGTYLGVYFTSNNGNSWTLLNTGLTNTDINKLVISEDTLYAGTYNGGVFLSTNNGSSWTAVNNGLTGNALQVRALAINGSNIYVGTYNSGVYLSTNNGNSWSAVNTGLTNLQILSFAISGNTIFAGTWGGVYMSTNNGNNWSAIGLSGNMISGIAISGNNIFAGINGGGVYLSTNNGTSWNPVNTGLTNNQVTALVVDGNNIFAGTSGGGVYLSTNNGNNWNTKNTSLTDTIINALTLSGNYLFAGTSQFGGVWKLQYSGTIATSANPTSGGTTSGGGTIILNQSCTVKAIPNTGFTFVNWTENGNIVSTDSNYSFSVTANRNLIANFTQTATQYTITTSANPINGGTSSGGGTFILNQTCTVKATPLTGYTFIDWTENGNIVSVDTSYTFTVAANRNLVANFMLITTQYSVTTSANPIIGGTTSGGGTFSFNQSCTVKATALTGYYFVNWTENNSIVSTDTSYTFTVTANRSLVANFAQNATQYTIVTSTNPTNGGTASGGGTFTLNQSCTVKATPLTGYTFVDWTENSNIISVDTNYTFNVTANRNLVANFFSTQGIDSYSFNKSIFIYPNPATDNFTIEVNTNSAQRFEIINILGHTVYTSYINKKAIVNTSAFKRGVYILKLYSDNEAVVRKFVKE